jgi:hypothetical protein
MHCCKKSLVGRTGVIAGISGVMPKTLPTKATITTAESILKAGLADLPGLAINEFLCVEIAQRATLARAQCDPSSFSS